MRAGVAVAETLLLAGLLLLTGFVVWDAGPALGLPDTPWLTWLQSIFPGLFAIETLAALGLFIAVYWALQRLGHGQLSFWMAAVLVVLPHAVPVWGHNQLEWYQFLGLGAEQVGERSLSYDAALFLACLAGLVALHRTMALRVLGRRMTLQGVGEGDRRRVLQGEGILLGGLLAAGLALALLAVLGAAFLGRYHGILAGSTWSVGAIGGGAAALLALTLLLWRRYR